MIIDGIKLNDVDGIIIWMMGFSADAFRQVSGKMIHVIQPREGGNKWKMSTFRSRCLKVRKI